MVTLINEGSLQEYDYNNEYAECKWRQNDKTGFCTMPIYQWGTCGTSNTTELINLP
jgi:hypothetical protein